MKYSILFPYYNRIDQLSNTFESFIKWYSDRDDYEVVIIEDQKQNDDMHFRLILLIDLYKDCIPIKLIRTKAKVSFSPSTAFNEGFDVSEGDFIIVSNPECLHETDILKGMDQIFDEDPDKYVVCSCKSLDQNGEMKTWYHHITHKDTKYHFCCGISKKNYAKIGGFDERYTVGYGYDDNSFRDSVLRAKLEFIDKGDMVVCHQWHQKLRPMAYRSLLKRNKDLYQMELNKLRIRNHA